MQRLAAVTHLHDGHGNHLVVVIVARQAPGPTKCTDADLRYEITLRLCPNLRQQNNRACVRAPLDANVRYGKGAAL